MVGPIAARFMASVYFICGFVGAGKTTYAKELAEREGAFRFCTDEWMIPLFGEHMERELFDARRSALQQLFQQSALQLVDRGVPVIFDGGFWFRAERESLRQWAGCHALEFEMIYLATSYEECCRRAAARNTLGERESYVMTPEMLALFWSWFEEPVDEPITVVTA